MGLNEYDDLLATGHPAQANEYDALLAQSTEQDAIAVRTSLQAAKPTTPDRRAQAVTLANQYQVPTDVVERNLDAFTQRQQAEQVDLYDLIAQSPALTEWLKTPDHAAVAKDDLANLGLIEWLTKAPQRAYTRGTAQVDFAKLRSESLFRDLSADEHARLDQLRGQMTAGGELGADTWFRGAITGAAQQIPNTFGAMLYGAKYAAVGAVEGGLVGAGAGSILPGVGTAAGAVSGAGYGARAGLLYGGFKFGAQLEAGLAYDEYLQATDELGRTMDPGVAKMAAIATGAINGGLEAYGLETLAKSVPGLKKLTGAATRAAVKQALKSPTVRAGLAEAAKIYGKTLTIETATEVAQRAVTIMSGELAKVADGLPTRGAADIASDLAAEGAGALQSFALIVAPGPVMTAAQRTYQAREAAHNPTLSTAIGEAVTQSKTAQRLPGAVEGLIAQATKDGPLDTVYLPVDTFTTYWQSKGEDPAKVAAQLTGQADALDHAQQTGADLAVPMAKYATQIAAVPEHDAFFGQEYRTAPEHMNAREAAVFEQEMAAEGTDKSGADYSENITNPADAVRETVLQQLQAAGVEPSVADTYATVTANAFTTLADRAGVDASALLERVQVQRSDEPIGDVADVAAFNQSLNEQIQTSAERLKTLAPADNTPDSRHVPFPTVETNDANVLFRAADRTQQRRVTVPIDALIATQPTVSESNVASKEPGGDPPIALEYEGRYYLADGTHRAVAAWARGEQTFEVTAWPVNPAWITQPPSYRSALEGIGGSEYGQGPTDGTDGTQAKQPARDLIIQHNITAENLRHVAKMGGLAVPSLAITKKDQSITGFGEITLLGDAAMADPKGYAAPKVFGSDVYSPRYPTIHYKFNAAGEKRFAAILKANPEGGQHYIDLDSLQKEGARYVEQSGAVMAAFLKEQGVEVPPAVVTEDRTTRGVTVRGGTDTFGTRRQLEDLIEQRGLRESYTAYAREMFSGLNPTEHIFKGFTNSGNRSYQPHTLENVVKILKKELRGSESSGNIYGVGQLRAKFTPQFRSVEQIRKEKGRLVSREAFEAVKQEVEQSFFAVADALRPYYEHEVGFRYSDTVMAVLEDAPRMGMVKALTEYAFHDVPSETLVAAAEFLERLRHLPTEYFEAKILRDVDLSEFRAAIVPEGTSEDVIDGLRKRGVEIVTYAKGDDADRQRVVSETADRLNERVLFQGRRASIVFTPDGRATIHLFAQSDLSSFLHESGHLYLELLRELVAKIEQTPADARTPQQQRMVDDLAALGAWFGTTEIGTDQHEQFARGFEAYLMEGKAPSIELRGVFARVASWFLAIYRNVRGLNVELTPEIRRVFDRLLASDDAIAAAEEEAQVAGMFLTAEAAGMTPEQFAAYQTTVQQAHDEATETLRTKALDALRRERQAWWATERETVRARVAADVHQQPVYVALSAMQKGTRPDGSPLVEGESKPEPLFKLAKDPLARTYTAEELTRLRRLNLYRREGGVHPDVAAETFGFSSGDEMVRAILAAPNMDATIDAETDRQMTAAHGDVLVDGTLQEQARQAVEQDGRAAVLEAEQKALAAKVRQVAPFVKAEQRAQAAERRETVAAVRVTVPTTALLQHIAQQRIAATRVRDIRPQVFWVAARQAGQRALDAAAKDDAETALQAKQQQRLNLELYRASIDAKADVDATRDYLRSFTEAKARQRLGKAGQDYLDQVDGILDRYEFAKATQKALDRRESLRKWVAQQERLGLPVEIPDAVLEDARRVNYQTLTVDELQGVRDAVKAIAYLARLKNRLLRTSETRELDAVTTEIDASIREHNTVHKLPLEFLPADLRARKVQEWFASHDKIASLARALDGYQDGGPMWESVIRPLNEAATREATMKQDATGRLYALFRDAYTGRDLAHLHDKQFIAAIDASLSKEARLSVALNWGNDGNRQRIRDGRRWSDEQVRAILDTLDERDWRFVQGVWDFINTYWPEIAAKQERVTGIAPEKVEAMPVDTRFGPFKGGYYPLAYDPRLSARAGSLVEAGEATLQKQAAYVHATTRRGHVEARAALVKEPVKLEFSVLYGHVDQVIHDLSHHEALIDVDRVLGSARVQQAIFETHGDIVYKQFKNALTDIAFGTKPAQDSIERALNFIRQGTTVAGLAWNVWTAVQQPAGVFNGMARVGPTWVLKGMGRMLRDAASMENTARWINARSEMMRLRFSTQQREIAELRTTLAQAGGWFDNLLRSTTADHLTRQDIESSYFAIIGYAQRLADMPTWLGAYEKAMATESDETRAVALADQAVLDAQGGGQIKDLAQAQRGSAAVKLFTNFYSYGNVLFNQTREAYGKTDFRRVGSVGQFLENLTLLYVFPAAMSLAAAHALGRSSGDDDEPWIVDMGKEIVGQAMNTMVLVRELGGFVRAANRGYEGPSGVRAISSLYRLKQQVGQGDVDRAAIRAAEDTAGVLFRLPLAQVQRSVDGFVALQEGKTSNPAALLVGAPKESRR